MFKIFSKQKIGSLIQLGIVLVIIILINLIGSYVYTRSDLTSENRYSLSDATKTMLKDVDDIIFFKVYLEGEFPAGFKKLRRETREMLNEFRAYNKNIQYEFINPSAGLTEEEKNNMYRELIQKGLKATSLYVDESEGSSQKIIFPGAVVTYMDRETPCHLLVTQKGQAPEQALNESVQNLEYNIANAIQKLISGKKKRIGFITSNGELDEMRTMDISQALAEYYTLERVRIDGNINALTKRDEINDNMVILPKYDVAVIAKPDSMINDRDKFILDQYLMYGGKIVWFVDMVSTSMDSLQSKARSIGLAKDLDMQDLFFNYGFRINTDLVMDLNCSAIPIATGNIDGEPQFDYLPWLYFPILLPQSEHPIVADLNSIKTEFVSSIDTIKTPSIKKSILLTTSPYSRTLNAPAVVSLETTKEKPDPTKFTTPPQTVALLLEGTFDSFYRNRIPPEIHDNKLIGFKKKSNPTKMVVFSDGDLIKNQLHYSRGYPLPLGYDQFTGQTFGNKDLVLNTINYLTNDEGILSARAKDFKIRLMDNTKIEENRVLIQIINTLLPVLLIFLFGIIRHQFRKRKYARKITS